MKLLTQRLDQAETATATATLDLATRLKSRARITLDDGREAGLMLDRGQLIRGGDLLGDDAGQEIVRVIAAEEQVSQAECADPLLLARACYHLGNRHVPLQIAKGLVRYHHDHVLDDMVRQLGLEVRVVMAPFEPESGAYQAAPHAHGHHHHAHH
ncbi:MULTISPECIES: urease accessory protein UreE [Brenneria]|uniref:Urease accessory protein UreE n=1 Tax=Brenneria nigrifluens DSM 30175 = ATCC 13028 TaxID=1121120 RepID=A0A2U1UTH7_9GAMM|nr:MULTISPECIES: urease accessory protein UreE [Brenneria]EHD19770.1 Urease accessory protein ureE [Brenneria sp. EniD312]PWC24974.1 urease accessory protein UreE [Brenneria nigrifluens DSM 30175 = ATCC 13028]QCR03029.1 urease accessory protein UreE [Brenneria nigrifluens DSM 30175 = ATCC 13028]